MTADTCISGRPRSGLGPPINNDMPAPPEFDPNAMFKPPAKSHNCPNCNVLANELAGAKAKIARLQQQLSERQFTGSKLSPTAQAARQWSEYADRVRQHFEETSAEQVIENVEDLGACFERNIARVILDK